MVGKRNVTFHVAVATSIGILAGCQPHWTTPLPGVGAEMAIDRASENLSAPMALDWSTQRVSGQQLTLKRDAHYKTMVFPAATAPWSVGGVQGLPMTSFGAGATDDVMAGPAAAFRTNPADPLYNMLFMVTRTGRFIRVNRGNPAIMTGLNLGVAKTFTRTNVTLSPNSTRAYVLADDGTLYIVNTLTMTTVGVLNVAGGYGISPFIDPFASRHDGTSDVLYLASNTGLVNRYTITGSQQGAVTNITAATSFSIANTVTPLFGGVRKIAAPPVVLGGIIYVGDQAGNFYAYDTVNSANSLVYTLGAPVNTAPAIEIQDGSYNLTDALGQPRAVPVDTPVFAFVNAGSSCAWLDLHSGRVTRSQALRIDDNDPNREFGYLLDYNFANGTTTTTLAARDGGNINTESPGVNLPGATANWSNDVLSPAETNTRGTATAPAGGPVVSYVRWQAGTAFPAGSVITNATLALTADALQPSKVPEVRLSSPYNLGTSTLWSSNTLTNLNRPLLSGGNIGVYQSGAISGQGNVFYFADTTYVWDVSAAFNTPQPSGQYALALAHNSGNRVLWPAGPAAGAAGLFAWFSNGNIDAVRFRNNPLNVNPLPAAAGDDRPLLSLTASTTLMPTATIETPPVIDAVTKRVYVAYTNALYSIDFSSPDAFSDTDVNLANSAVTPHTIFNLLHYGDTDNTPSGVGGRQPGGAFNNRTRHVTNYTAPALSFDGSAAYVVSRTPQTDGAAPVQWRYAMNKLTLPLSATADRRVSNTTPVLNVPGQSVLTGLVTDQEASAYMLIDPFAVTAAGGNIYLGLANGRFYQFDR